MGVELRRSGIGSHAPRPGRSPAASTRSVRAATRHEAGLTLVEVLIAIVLLLAITLGVLPMFLTSMRDTTSADQYTDAANYARTRAEEFFQFPFNSAPMTITGDENPDIACDDNFFSEYYSREDERWKDGTAADAAGAGETALWVRETTIRQLNVLEMIDELAEDPPIDDCTETVVGAGGDPGSIHLKEITVSVADPATFASSILRTRKQVTVRLYKSQ